MSIQSRAYKLLSKAFGQLLGKERLRRISEAVGQLFSGQASVRRDRRVVDAHPHTFGQSLETLESRLLMSTTSILDPANAGSMSSQGSTDPYATQLALSSAPSGQGFGVSDSGDHFGTIDIATGAFSLIGQLRSADGLTIFSDIENLAIDPTTGIFYGVNTGTLVTIDPTTAIVTVIGNTGLSDVDALTFNAAGEMFAVDATPAINPGQLNRIDKATGQATLISQLLMPVPDELVAMGAIDPKLDGIAFDPTSGDLIAAYSSYGSMSFMVRVEMATGQILNIGPSGVDDIEDIAFGADGVLYGTLGDTGAIHGQRSGSFEGLVSIDVVTGLATPIGLFGDTPLFDNRWDFEGFAVLFGGQVDTAPRILLSLLEIRVERICPVVTPMA